MRSIGDAESRRMRSIGDAESRRMRSIGDAESRRMRSIGGQMTGPGVPKAARRLAVRDARRQA